jgi:hypothetical protein
VILAVVTIPEMWSYSIECFHTLKNVNSGLDTNIYSLLLTPGVQSYNLYLNVVHFSALVLVSSVCGSPTLESDFTLVSAFLLKEK